MTSYQVSQSNNFQSLLWAGAGAIAQTPTSLTRVVVWLSLLAQPIIADAHTLFAGLLTVLAYALGIVAAVGALALLLAHPPIVLAGLAIVGYGCLTYPRSKAVRK